MLNPPPGGGRASSTVTTSLLLWVLEGDQESCSDALAQRWGLLRSRVSALSAAGEVSWSDSLSHRLFLFNKAMDIVALDGGGGRKGKGAGGAGGGGGAGSAATVTADGKSKGGTGGDLPRAGEMMAGLARQSQTLAVYIGLEDAPDVSGALSEKPSEYPRAERVVQSVQHADGDRYSTRTDGIARCIVLQSGV